MSSKRLIPGTPEPITGSEYRKLLIQYRNIQLEKTAANVRRIAATYQAAIESITAKVESLPPTVERTGTGWQAAQFNLLRDLKEALAVLERDYRDSLDLSMLDSAQVAADREKRLAELLGVNPSPNLSPILQRSVVIAGDTFSVQFGRLAESAVNVVQARYYGDGITLSERLGSLSTYTRMTVEDAITQGLADGSSAKQIAAKIQKALGAEGESNPKYRAMMIARTETVTAFREASVQATIDEATGNLKPYISAVGWRLSSSHPEADMCDLYAAHDEGLGPGNYLPGALPVSHPHCLCYSVSILKSLPDEQFVRKEPEVEKVPKSTIEYYARQGDPVAQRTLAG